MPSAKRTFRAWTYRAWSYIQAAFAGDAPEASTGDGNCTVSDRLKFGGAASHRELNANCTVADRSKYGCTAGDSAV